MGWAGVDVRVLALGLVVGFGDSSASGCMYVWMYIDKNSYGVHIHMPLTELAKRRSS